MIIFSKPCTSSKNKIKFEQNFSNYGKKDLKRATVVDTSKFAKKVNLASVESDVGKLHINQLKKVPVV